MRQSRLRFGLSMGSGGAGNAAAAAPAAAAATSVGTDETVTLGGPNKKTWEEAEGLMGCAPCKERCNGHPWRPRNSIPGKGGGYPEHAATQLARQSVTLGSPNNKSREEAEGLMDLDHAATQLVVAEQEPATLQRHL